MPVLREVIEVAAPLEKAFAYVSDFASAAEWDPGVNTATQVGDGPVAVGTRYELEVDFRGRSLPMTCEVTALDPPRRVVLKGEGATVRAVDEITFEAIDSGTRIHYTADLKLKGLLRLAEPLLGGAFDKLAKKAMAGLKAALDG